MVLLKCPNSDLTSSIEYSSTFHYGSIKIKISMLIFPSLSTSTFHYGSIKIMPFVVSIALVSASTFHYGSIKIIIY